MGDSDLLAGRWLALKKLAQPLPRVRRSLPTETSWSSTATCPTPPTARGRPATSRPH